jgi:hypothetical protein
METDHSLKEATGMRPEDDETGLLTRISQICTNWKTQEQEFVLIRAIRVSHVLRDRWWYWCLHERLTRAHIIKKLQLDG